VYVGFSGTTGVGSGVGVGSASDALVPQAVSMSNDEKLNNHTILLRCNISSSKIAPHLYRSPLPNSLFEFGRGVGGEVKSTRPT
jgi:hypothetical protein